MDAHRTRRFPTVKGYSQSRVLQNKAVTTLLDDLQNLEDEKSAQQEKIEHLEHQVEAVSVALDVEGLAQTNNLSLVFFSEYFLIFPIVFGCSSIKMVPLVPPQDHF